MIYDLHPKEAEGELKTLKNKDKTYHLSGEGKAEGLSVQTMVLIERAEGG